MAKVRQIRLRVVFGSWGSVAIGQKLADMSPMIGWNGDSNEPPMSPIKKGDQITF